MMRLAILAACLPLAAGAQEITREQNPSEWIVFYAPCSVALGVLDEGSTGDPIEFESEPRLFIEYMAVDLFIVGAAIAGDGDTPMDQKIYEAATLVRYVCDEYPDNTLASILWDYHGLRDD